MAGILSNREFLLFLPFNGVLLLSTYMRATFLAGYAGGWFAGCKTVSQDNHCHKNLDYDEYNYALQLSNSISGLLALLSAGMIGYLSDRFGRKVFLYMQVLTTWLPYIATLFTNNMYFFFCLLPVMGLNGNSTTLTPAQNGYIADVLPPALRLKGYSTVFLMGGTCLLLGTLASYVISSAINDYFNFYVINGLFTVNMLYLAIFVKEPSKTAAPASPQQQKKMCNPCKPFRFLCNNSVVFWICLSSSFIRFQTLGLLDSAIVVFNDAFPHHDASVSNTISLLFISGFSLGLILGSTVVLPLLRKRLAEYQILMVTLFLLMANSVLMASITFIKALWMIFVTSFVFGNGTLSTAVYNSILTQFVDEHEVGAALGVMLACNSIMGIVTPFGFAAGYGYFKSIGMPYVIFAVCLISGFIGFICCLPMKGAINARRNEMDMRRRAKVIVNESEKDKSEFREPLL